MTRPRIGSLFSGYGGLDMGVTAALGGSVAWHVEFDKAPSKILAHHWPDVPNYGDVTAVDWSAVEPVDIITGGFPCQDVSGAGLRKGLRPDTRSGLWAQFAYAIDQLRPELVVIENVRGLLSARAHSDVEPCPWCVGEDPDGSLRALGAVLGGLADIGYDARWICVFAGPADGSQFHIGAPHGRPRVFIAAYPECGGWHRWARETGRGALGRIATHGNLEGALLPTPAAYDGERGGAQHPDKRRAGGHSVSLQDALYSLLPTPAVNDMGEGKTVEAWDEWTAKMKAKHDNGNGHGKSLAIELQRVGSTWGPYAQAVSRWERIIGREAPPPSDGVLVREWMMGLPLGHVSAVPGLSRSDKLKALGNGVIPAQATAALHLAFSAQEVAA